MDNETTKANDWTGTPLCSRYLLVMFEALAIQLTGPGVSEDRTLRWSLGILADGQQEILGTWLTTARRKDGWLEVFGDLKGRGVEGINFVVSDDQETVLAALGIVYPNATLLPPLPQALAQQSDLPPRLHRALRENEDKVATLRRSVARAVARHGQFADSVSAAAFVLDALNQAEQRINLAKARSESIAGTAVRGRRTRGSTLSHPGL